jgi:hypothetical protein
MIVVSRSRGDLYAAPRDLPAPDAALHQVLRRGVRDARGVEPRRRVHPLVHLLLLDVHVPAEVDDPDVAVYVGRDATHVRIAYRVFAAQDHRENAVLDNVTDRACDLVEALLYIGRDDEDVAYVRDPELLPDVYAHLVVVGAVVRRGAPDALRPEAKTGTEGGPDVQRRPEYRHVVVPNLPHVLHVRKAHKRAHPGEVWQFRPHERKWR